MAIDHTAGSKAALAVDYAASGHLATVLQLERSAFAAFMLLHIVLLEGLFDHGLVLAHVSLAAFFHGRRGHRSWH